MEEKLLIVPDPKQQVSCPKLAQALTDHGVFKMDDIKVFEVGSFEKSTGTNTLEDDVMMSRIVLDDNLFEVPSSWLHPIPKEEQADSFRQLQDRIGKWADKTIPVDKRTVFSAFTKMVMEEIPEFISSGMQDPKELGDIGVLLLDIAYLLGIDLFRGISEKMDINETRIWGIDPVSGLMKHIEE